ncbi:uncharacterized protein LOC124454728 [Xenia sp. Carnegie-2017]|uniref:uncharacterized protein LOC124454728 n=1 Tax=Xenia sp. Carnegie-2017 TaxID=2897299 RepID=UPI001F0469AA|nr:uncharacterized protein LOC124454728 [Xenia sp. Carnegie-2017]
MANLQDVTNTLINETKVLEKQSSFEEDEDCNDDEIYSVSNPPSPQNNRRQSLESSDVSDPAANSDMSAQTKSDVNDVNDGRSDRESVNHCNDKTLQTQCKTGKMDAKLASLQANSLFKPVSSENITGEDQQFLYDVVNSVLNANGVGMFKKKRLRGLMIKELCRQKVVNCFLREISDKTKSDIVSDKCINKNVLRGMLDVLQGVVSGLEISLSNFGLGGVTSAYHFLRLAHTHYYGREIKNFNAAQEETLRVSPTESLSNLSDISDATVSANGSGDRSTLVISDSEQDSGHCDASEASEQILTQTKPRKYGERTKKHIFSVCNYFVHKVTSLE